jgi:hypothetical protein
MLSNTITVTIDSVAKVLTRIQEDSNGSVYRLKNGTEQIDMKVRHSITYPNGYQLNRHNLLWEHTVFETDTTPEYKWVASITLSERDMSDPTYLTKTIAGIQSAFASLWDTVAIGDR